MKLTGLLFHVLVYPRVEVARRIENSADTYQSNLRNHLVELIYNCINQKVISSYLLSFSFYLTNKASFLKAKNAKCLTET